MSRGEQKTNLTPKQVLLKYINDPNSSDEVKRDCAKALLPYVHAEMHAEIVRQWPDLMDPAWDSELDDD